MHNKSMKNKKGFTLIELLLVIAIISALAVTVFVALNPAKRLKDSRDARRSSDIETILSAIHTYIVDNAGALPSGLTTTEKQLGTNTGAACTAIATGGCAAIATSCVDLATPLAAYLKSIPYDPSLTSVTGTAMTKYTAVIDANGIVTVRACGKEGTGDDISVSR